MKQKSLKTNSILNIIKTLSSIIFPLITFPYISRVLMPENIGKINFSVSFVSYFTLIASLGIATYAIRECSTLRKNKKKLSIIASQIFSINLITTTISYSLMLITLLFFRQFDSYRTIIIIQSTTILFTTFGCDWINSAMEDFYIITIRTISFQILSLLLMFAFVQQPKDYIRYVIITVISSSGANIFNIVYRKKYCKIRFTIKIDWKIHFKPIILLFVMILAQTIFNSSDITMLGLMKGNYEVGIYSTAVKINNLISQVVTSLAWVIMPRMSLYFAENSFDKINQLLRKTFNILISIGFPCSVGCICLSQEILTIFAGSRYTDAAMALRILMVGFIFSLIGGAFLGNMVLLPSKREDIYMIVCCIATVVNLLLNYILIPVYGVNAAAATTTFASLLIMLLLIFLKDKHIKLDYVWETMLPPTIGCIAIIVVCKTVKTLVDGLMICTILSMLLSVITYILIQIILKNKIVAEMISFILKIVERNK